MNSNDLGLENPGGQETVDNQQQAGSSNGDDAQVHQADTPGSGTDSDQNQDGTGQQDDQPDGENTQQPAASDADTRVREMMSNWHKEQDARSTAENELAQYKQQYGPLGAGQHPAQRPGHEAPPVQDTSKLPPSMREGWNPQTLEELQQAMKEEREYTAEQIRLGIQQEQKHLAEARQQAKEQVDGLMDQIRSVDPQFDEKAFFTYAATHNFPVKTVQDLRSVYSAYFEQRQATVTATKNAIKNKQDRNAPVNVPGGGKSEQSVPFSKISGAHSSRDLVHDMLKGRQ